jgi:hypothetical protein
MRRSTNKIQDSKDSEYEYTDKLMFVGKEII